MTLSDLRILIYENSQLFLHVLFERKEAPKELFENLIFTQKFDQSQVHSDFKKNFVPKR